VKGYDAGLIDSRRAIENELFHSPDPVRVADALDRVLSLKRPVVVIVDNRVHGALQGWLAQSGRGQLLFNGDDLAAWLFPFAQLAAPLGTRKQGGLHGHS